MFPPPHTHTTSPDQKTGSGQAGQETSDYHEDIQLLNDIVFRLHVRNALYGLLQHEERERHSGLDDLVDLHCTPLGVTVLSDRGSGYGVVQYWRRVGSYLRRAMSQI